MQCLKHEKKEVMKASPTDRDVVKSSRPQRSDMSKCRNGRKREWGKVESGNVTSPQSQCRSWLAFLPGPCKRPDDEAGVWLAGERWLGGFCRGCANADRVCVGKLRERACTVLVLRWGNWGIMGPLWCWCSCTFWSPWNPSIYCHEMGSWISLCCEEEISKRTSHISHSWEVHGENYARRRLYTAGVQSRIWGRLMWVWHWDRKAFVLYEAGG
ncbi:hypothetical protein B0T09DRAFT_328510 [Sordaria sp. MPI-SDFR-AT-0083]|nr:hypothetical protein B0T09DRAFT_328510 [Sordaria sp. MPI-SDFR-AT-0083]